MNEIDVNDSFYYDISKPEIYDRTLNRLNKIKKLGLIDFGGGHFGIKDVMAGFYIEMIWNFSDEEFDFYVSWIKRLKK